MCLRQRAQTIIHPGIHIHDVAMRFDSVDSRKEAGTLQAIAVQLIRRDVRGRHQGNAAGKQRFH